MRKPLLITVGAAIQARLDRPGPTPRRPWAGRAGARPLQEFGLLDFDDHLDLDHRAQGQRRHAEGGAGVASPISEYSDEQVGASVDHLGVCFEIVRGVDEAADADDALHLGQVADLELEGGEKSEGGLARGFIGVLFGEVASHLAGDDFSVGATGNLAGQKHELAAGDRGHVVGHGSTGFRQGEPERLELGFGIGPGAGLRGSQRREQSEAEQESAGGEERFHVARVRERTRLAS